MRNLITLVCLAFLLPALGCSDAVTGPGGLQGDPSHTLRVSFPNGGEIFGVGDTIKTLVVCDTSVIYNTEILLSVDAGLNWFSIVPQALPTEEGRLRFDYVIPDTLKGIVGSSMVALSTRSDECLIKVRWYENFNVNDVSDGFFFIR